MKNIERTAMPVLSVLWGLSRYHNKRYCYPSQNKIMELLGSRFFIQISKATLNRWLRSMEDTRLIKRVRRITYHERKGLMFKSTVYKFTKRSMILLLKIGIPIKKMWSRVKDLMKQKKIDKEFPIVGSQWDREKGVSIADDIDRVGKNYPGIYKRY
ncbi:hypothetical protein ES702_06527 [subsurface metagenome]